MLSWSFIVMQRDEASSQTAQSVKRLISKPHAGPSLKITVAQIGSHQWLATLIFPPGTCLLPLKTDQTGN